MRLTGVGTWSGLGLGAFLGAPACESQVGAAYEGEVQFSIEGTLHPSRCGPVLPLPGIDGSGISIELDLPPL